MVEEETSNARETPGPARAPDEKQLPLAPSEVYATDARRRTTSKWESLKWYSLAFRMLWKFQLTFLHRHAPLGVKNAVVYWQNFALAFHYHALNKVWSGSDPLKNLQTPKHEHVQLPSIWVVEIYPPSKSVDLQSRLSENGWDKTRRVGGLGQGNREKLESSRSGHGWRWWELAHIVDPKVRPLHPLAHSQKLPKSFQEIEIVAVQIGDGLTAVLARFQLQEHASARLDRAWHQAAKPRISWGGGLPRALNRKEVAIETTRKVRDDIHQDARHWLKKACPGFFVATSLDQPVLDLLLLEEHDPSRAEAGYELSECLYGLGIPRHDPLRRTAPTLPGFLLTPSVSPLQNVGHNRAWTLWGRRHSLSATADFRASGASAKIIHRQISDILVQLSLSEFLNALEYQYADLRDRAHTQRQKIRRRDLEHLRSNFLTLSLDVTSVVRDIDGFYASAQLFSEGTRFEVFKALPIEHTDVLNRDEVTAQPKTDFGKSLKADHLAKCHQLAQSDKNYREILSTVASIGSSIDTFKVGRMALLVALASLGVALVTLLLTDVGNASVLSAIVTKLRSTDWTSELVNYIRGVWCHVVD